MRHLADFALVAFALAAGCASPPAASMATPDAPEMVSASCQEATQHSDLAWIQDNVFAKQCSLGGCHAGAASNAGHLNLASAATSYQDLVGQPAQTESGWMRVVAGDADKSYLLVAIDQATGPEPVGGYMPQTSTELCSDKREAIQRWIEAGAPAE